MVYIVNTGKLDKVLRWLVYQHKSTSLSELDTVFTTMHMSLKIIMKTSPETLSVFISRGNYNFTIVLYMFVLHQHHKGQLREVKHIKRSSLKQVEYSKGPR